MSMHSTWYICVPPVFRAGWQPDYLCTGHFIIPYRTYFRKHMFCIIWKNLSPFSRYIDKNRIHLTACRGGSAHGDRINPHRCGQRHVLRHLSRNNFLNIGNSLFYDFFHLSFFIALPESMVVPPFLFPRVSILGTIDKFCFREPFFLLRSPGCRFARF